MVDRRPDLLRRATSLTVTARRLAKQIDISCAVSFPSWFRCGADFFDFGVAAARHFLISGLDDDIALFTQSFQVFAHGGFDPLAVEVILNFGFDFFVRLFAFGVVLENLKNQKALLGLDDRSKIVLLHDEDLVFQFFRKLTALVDAEVAALLGGRAIGPALGEFGELFTILQLFLMSSAFFLMSATSAGLAFGLEFDGAQCNLFRADKLGFVLFVIFLAVFWLMVMWEPTSLPITS